MKTKVITCACLKGGVGKSTISVNLAHALTELHPELKVLVIDFDPQATASNMVGIPANLYKGAPDGIAGLLDDFVNTKAYYDMNTIRKLIVRPFHSAKKRIRIANRFGSELIEVPYKFDFLSTSMKLSYLEVALARNMHPHIKNTDTLLKNVVDVIRLSGDYSYIIIDSMPSLGPLTINAICTSDYIVIPTTMTYSSILGIDYVKEAVDTLSKYMNKSIKILGIARNKYHKNAQVDMTVDEYLFEDYSDFHKFEAKIPETMSIEKAVMESKIASFANEIVYNTFIDLAKEVLARIEYFESNPNLAEEE